MGLLSLCNTITKTLTTTHKSLSGTTYTNANVWSWHPVTLSHMSLICTALLSSINTLLSRFDSLINKWILPISLVQCTVVRLSTSGRSSPYPWMTSQTCRVTTKTDVCSYVPFRCYVVGRSRPRGRTHVENVAGQYNLLTGLRSKQLGYVAGNLSSHVVDVVDSWRWCLRYK